ncbi:MAG TPA: ABC transporter substrate-binding protein [Sedimentisphaerales bacterium]|nr:ABC transporter substrate-binding protein [Sedimentisphaerales bacterium]
MASSSFAADQLILLSPHWQGIRIEFTDAFRAHYRETTGRDVELHWLDIGGGGSGIIRYIESQFSVKPDGIGVDVVFGGGIDPYTYLKEKGFLAAFHLPDEILAEIAPSIGGVPLYDYDRTWYSATMAGFGIIYNKAVLHKLNLPEPRTWADLDRPEFFSWVGSADPRKSGSAHMAYEIILQAYGWERGWEVLTAMAANARGFTASAGQVPKDVTAGEVAAGLSIDFYAWAQVLLYGEDVIGFVLPQDLTVVNGDAIAILKGAPNRQVAEDFVTFVMSEKGQRLFMLNRGEPGGPVDHDLGKFTVMPRLYDELKGRTPVTVNPFQWHSAFRYDPERGTIRRTILGDLIGTMLIDPHRRLQAAWQRAIHSDDPETALQRLAAVPVTEQQVLDIASQGLWDDTAFKNRTLREWSDFARAKYAGPPTLASRLRWLPAAVALALVIYAAFTIKRRNRAS